ncbi:VWA domain-containing protein [Heliorestis acidaminivorans]|uniref:VWA domain-containing protein n=1 Tax=Heliorestis acidaminivorans TaxID=553427 RepID=A0A6I0EZS8_9FIRM|nr:VWA domain-containing protein [Heliorestis acidaminivorans]KAB2952155.1 VWA domain-containing protein [Heliorestis acidaminivorans]
MLNKKSYLAEIDGTIETTRYERRQWKEIREASQKIQDVEKRLDADYNSFSPMLQDLWASLYQDTSQFREDEDIPLSQRLNKSIMEKVLAMSEWEEVHAWTKQDVAAAALGGLSLSEKVCELLPQDLKEQMNQVQQTEEKAQQAQERMEDFLNAAYMLEQAAEQKKDAGDESGAEEATKKATAIKRKAKQEEKKKEEAQLKLNQLGHEVSEAVNQGVQAIAGQMRQELQQEAQEQSDTAQAMQQFGLGAGQAQYMDPAKRIKFASALRKNKKLSKIAQIAGRMKSIASHKRKNKTHQPPTEVVDVELGNNLSNVLPSELALFCNPATKMDFLRRYSEGNLMQRKLEGKEKEGRGPIVVCLDSSSSMKQETGNGATREEWSKAITLALFDIARRQGRAFAAVHFANEHKIKSYLFPKPKKAKPEELLDMITLFLRGGTNFERPLQEAVHIIEKSSYNKADIVFITDGESYVSSDFLQSFNELKEKKQFSVITVLLDAWNTETVEQFSDKITKVVSGQDTETIDLIFNDIQ